MKLPFRRDESPSDGAQAVERLLEGVERVNEAVAQLREMVESMRRES